MSHYFTNDNNLSNLEYKFDYDFLGRKYLFLSKDGVFSKKRVDFGTNVLINSLPNLDGKTILDVGCGIGIISIMLAGAYKDCFVTGIDVNDRALSLAKENALKNKVNNVTFLNSNLYDNITDSFDVIISNPPIRAGKKIVHGVVEKGYDHLNEGGKIYLVIQIKQGGLTLKKRMEEVFGNAYTIEKKNGYLILMSEK